MLTARIEGTPEMVPKNGLLTLSGYGIKAIVEGGHLVVEDGVGPDRRRGRFSRATAGLKRLVILGHSGIVSLDAFRWLNDVGIAFVHIDCDGNLIAAISPSGLDDGRLRRAQAIASDSGNGTESGAGTGIGFGIARDLIREKLAGQLNVLEGLREKSAIETVKLAIAQIPQTRDVDALRLLESQAALAYWEAWRYLDVLFVHRDKPRVPEHWLTFGVRRSLLTHNPRKATNPANAILNYLYAILEAEARIAALTMGLDPRIGIMHADLKARDSFACDLMEPVRPKVDNFALDLLQHRTFKKTDFFETREGACRVMPPFTQTLIDTSPRWAKELAPIAESVAQRLLSGGKNAIGRALPTPLTGEKRRDGRAGYRRRYMKLKETKDSKSRQGAESPGQ